MDYTIPRTPSNARSNNRIKDEGKENTIKPLLTLSYHLLTDGESTHDITGIDLRGALLLCLNSCMGVLSE
jgi:hypothetical protein